MDDGERLCCILRRELEWIPVKRPRPNETANNRYGMTIAIMTEPLPPHWRAIRAQILARDPHCRIAGPGCQITSIEVDHVIPRNAWPKGKPGCHAPSNLRGVCRVCHNARTKALPASVGRWRAQIPVRR